MNDYYILGIIAIIIIFAIIITLYFSYKCRTNIGYVIHPDVSPVKQKKNRKQKAIITIV